MVEAKAEEEEAAVGIEAVAEAKVEDKVEVVRVAKVAKEAKAEEVIKTNKVRHKVVGARTPARPKPTPGTKGPGTLMGPRSRPASSTGSMGNLLFIALNQAPVPGGISLCQELIINEISTDSTTKEILKNLTEYLNCCMTDTVT